MENFSIKLNLAKLENVGIANLTGNSGEKKCIVIPIEDNKIFVSDKGIYLDLLAIATAKSPYGDTHFLKRSLSKEEREKERETGERIGKILGNMKPFTEFDTSSAGTYATYQQTQAPSAAPAPQAPTPQAPSMPDPTDNLPF